MKRDYKNYVKDVLNDRVLEGQILDTAKYLRTICNLPYEIKVSYTQTSNTTLVFNGSLRTSIKTLPITNIQFDITINPSNHTYYLVFDFWEDKVFITDTLYGNLIPLYAIEVGDKVISSIEELNPYFDDEEIQEALTNIRNSIDVINTNITNLEAKVLQAQKDIQSLDKFTDQLDSRVEVLENWKPTIDSKVNANVLDIANLKSWQEQISPTVAANTEAIGHINDSIEDVNGEIADIQADIVEIEDGNQDIKVATLFFGGEGKTLDDLTEVFEFNGTIIVNEVGRNTIDISPISNSNDISIRLSKGGVYKITYYCMDFEDITSTSPLPTSLLEGVRVGYSLSIPFGLRTALSTESIYQSFIEECRKRSSNTSSVIGGTNGSYVLTLDVIAYLNTSLRLTPYVPDISGANKQATIIVERIR